MKTTGVKDKNNIEIKEGDAVLFRFQDNGIVEGPFYFHYFAPAFRWVAHKTKNYPKILQDFDVTDIASKVFWSDLEIIK